MSHLKILHTLKKATNSPFISPDFQKTGSTNQSKNPLEIVFVVAVVSEMFWSFAFILFFCEFGEMVTSKFDWYHEELCKCNWYLFPMEIQPLYLMFITNTQLPAHIRCFGNILCIRDSFKKVREWPMAIS